MAGLIDVGILKPELSNALAAGYRGAEQQRQQTEMNQIKLDQLKQDRAAMTQLQDSLKAAGKDPDLNKVFDALIATANPDYVMKGIEGKRRLAEQVRAEGMLRQFAPELFPSATPAAPMAVPAAPMAAPAAPVNALAPAPATTPAAPANAMAPAPAAAPDINALRRQLYALSSVDDPRAKAMAEVLKGQISELTKTHTVGGRIVSGAGDVRYTAPSDLGTLEQEIADLRANGVALNDPRIIARQNKITKLTTHQPGTTVNVSTEKAYGSAFGGKLADVDISKMTTAEKAPALAESANRIIGLVQQGNVFTGPAADIKLNLARALNVAGANNQEKIANTESLIAATGQSTLDAIKGAGLGTGQGFTDKDLKFLQGVAGGTINLTPQTLTELATLQHRVATKSAESWNRRVKEMPQNVVQGTGLSTAPITVPPLQSVMKKGGAAAPAAPAGVDPALWNVMTPQERALWQTK